MSITRKTRQLHYLVYLFALLIQPVFSYAQSTINDFDKVCGYFIELSKQTNLQHMTPSQRNKFIMAKMANNLNPNSDAKVAWEAVSHAVPAQRYELFKSGAEEVLNKTWQCPAMQQLALSTGEVE